MLEYTTTTTATTTRRSRWRRRRWYTYHQNEKTHQELCLLNPCFLGTSCSFVLTRIPYGQAKDPHHHSLSSSLLPWTNSKFTLENRLVNPQRGKASLSPNHFQGLWLSVLRSVFSFSNRRYIYNSDLSSFRNVSVVMFDVCIEIQLSRRCFSSWPEK